MAKRCPAQSTWASTAKPNLPPSGINTGRERSGMRGTRRGFIGWSISGAGAALTLPAPAAPVAEDYYDKLGVTKIINAAGTYTFLTASIMPPQVQAAVAQAAKHPVRLAQLQKAAGEYLAKKLQCEGALVTAGASSALTLGTAACMTVADPSAA